MQALTNICLITTCAYGRVVFYRATPRQPFLNQSLRLFFEKEKGSPMRLFEKAKTRSLVVFARDNGFALRKQGSGYTAKHCPHCHHGGRDVMSIYSKDGIERWNCFRCNRGGSVIDFAAAIWGIPEREAAKRLANDEEVAVADVGASKEIASSSEAVKEAVSRLFQVGHTSVAECIGYLKSRGIGEKTVSEAVRRGLLRFLPASPFQAKKFLYDSIGVEGLMNAGFLKQESVWPGIAFRPMVFFFPGLCAAEFRLSGRPRGGEPKAIRYGHVKWPWWWREDGTVSTILIVEGVIDLLSMVEMGLKKGEAVIGVPGASSWRPEWLAAARKSYPDADFVVALDADDAGRRAANGIRETLENMGASVSERFTPHGKDWNEFLVSSRAA